MSLWALSLLFASVLPANAASVPAAHVVPSAKGQVALGAMDAVQPRPADGDTCRNSDPGKLCLAIKYAVFADANGAAPLTAAQAATAVRTINGTWAKCNLGFQLEQFTVVNPSDSGIRYRIGNYSELDDIRTSFGSDKQLLIAATGAWDRGGSLGDSGANAWTAMPGGPPYGAVIENTVSGFANIIGHELGHYLNLYHRPDVANLMNPIIYSSSTGLTPEQCQTARDTAKSSWAAMLR